MYTSNNNGFYYISGQHDNDMTYKEFTVPFDCDVAWYSFTSTLGTNIYVDGALKVSFTGGQGTYDYRNGLFTDVKQGTVIRFNSQFSIGFAGISKSTGQSTVSPWNQIISNNISLS